MQTLSPLAYDFLEMNAHLTPAIGKVTFNKFGTRSCLIEQLAKIRQTLDHGKFAQVSLSSPHKS
jgi:hypothetical protein